MRFLRWILSLMVAALASTSALAADAKDELTGALNRIRDAGVLNVGYAESSMPFSYLDKAGSPIGYSIDACTRVTDAVKNALKKPDLRIAMRPIKPDDAASYIASGVIDIHCGPILNTPQAKTRVDFGMTYFVTRYRFASHESATMNELSDMQGKTLVSIAGTPAMNALNRLGAARNLDMTIVSAKNDDEAFRIFQSDAAHAVVLDEVSLAYGVAKNRFTDPSLVMLSDGAFGAEPYSLVFARGDAPLRKLVGDTMRQLFTSGAILPIYAKWFQSAIPPAGIDMALPPSEPLAKAFRNPTDSSDPAAYGAN